MQQQLSETVKQPGDAPLEMNDDNQKDAIANMLGLMGANAVESIMSDITKMLDRNMRDTLDGYVLALSRIIRHDLAWKCIVHSFADANIPIPQGYYRQFDKSLDDAQKQRTTVQ